MVSVSASFPKKLSWSVPSYYYLIQYFICSWLWHFVVIIVTEILLQSFKRIPTGYSIYCTINFLNNRLSGNIRSLNIIDHNYYYQNIAISITVLGAIISKLLCVGLFFMILLLFYIFTFLLFKVSEWWNQVIFFCRWMGSVFLLLSVQLMAWKLQWTPRKFSSPPPLDSPWNTMATTEEVTGGKDLTFSRT